MTPDPELQPLAEVIADPDRLVRAVASGARKGRAVPWRRVELRWVDLKAGPHLQVESFDATQSFTRNVSLQDVAEETDTLLALPFGSWHLDSTGGALQARWTKKDRLLVQRSGKGAVATADRSHDRPKVRLLDPGADFLSVLGITTAQGQVKASRRDKLMQVEAFLRALDPVVQPARDAAASAGRPVHVVDLGCGNAYLSLAAYHWLTQAGTVATITGVDTKAQAREHNRAVVAELGWSEDTEFVEASIGSVELTTPPDLVLALHACDTATDDALARAVRWETPVVLAAPCCHHDLQRQLKQAGEVPRPYGLLNRHGIIRERFADVLTDAVRASVLRLLGYRVEVIEFVGSTHTPRNTLLRAVRTGADPTPEQLADYRDLVDQWQLRPALAASLHDLLAARGL